MGTLLTGAARQLRQAGRNPGIGLRLGISFAAVAILAIAANLTLEHGASVIQTTKTYSPSPIVREIPRVTAPQPAPVSIPTRAPAPTAVSRLEDGDLLDALGQFDRTVVLRAQAATPENKALLATTARHLADEGAAFVSKAAARAPESRIKALTTHARRLRAAGDALIGASDARRASFAAYGSQFDNLDRLMKSTLDHNWTIFGRVIARQSLMSMSRELDDIRRGAAQLTAAGGYDPSVLNALADSESKFSNALQQNAAGLTRSQGAQWLERMRIEFSGVISSRIELASVDHQAAEAFSTFEQDVTSAGTLVRAITESSRKSRALRTPIAPPPAAALTLTTTPPAQPDPVALPPPRTRIYTQKTSGDFSSLDRAIIAAISAAVLILLLAVSIATARSIVLPIRQFMATTGRLTGGDAAARFERGGISELDALAISLNQMASTLESAQSITREYQGSLELRIEERTRQLQHLAEHDLLTGLPNKRQLVAHLDATLQRAAAASAPVAVFFLDLDNFKNINDSMGHTFGDRVLQAVAKRLTLVTAPDGFAARLGGDEFTVVYSRSESVERLTQYGVALVNAFHKPLRVEGRELLISISVGASIYPEHETSPEALLSAADAALFQAKNLGRNQLCLFSRELLQTASEKFNTEQGLRRAVERNEFELVFQPEVNFEIGGIKLVEALLRWRLPNGRRISPMQFLSTAQESGLITRIGDWVLRSAIESAAKWHHGTWPDVRVAINVSASQLLSKDFAQRVQQLLLEHRLPPRCIEIELTETVLQTGATTIDTLRELRQLDIAVALDDFGTGFSSLASLQHLPLTRVKLDQSLIAAIDTDQRALAITSAITSLCEKLGLEVTAEGIERPEQLRLLLEHRSMCLQGYLISHPIDGDSVTAAIATMPERLQSLFLTTSLAPPDTPVRLAPDEPAAFLFEFGHSESA
ncbi:MAG: putative bifunctional diguanylate cyclase/phosphodiesterase [Steroidobacteraceae bacterium]